MKPTAKRFKISEVQVAKPKNKALDDLFSQFNDLVSTNKSKNSHPQDQSFKGTQEFAIISEDSESKNFKVCLVPVFLN